MQTGGPVRAKRIPALPVSPYMKEEEPVAIQGNTDYYGSGHELFVLIAYAQTYTLTNICLLRTAGAPTAPSRRSCR